MKAGSYRGIGTVKGIHLGSLSAALLAAVALALAIATVARAAGEISQHPGRSGCISASRKTVGECRRGPGLKQAGGVAVSPDGKNAYVASYGSNAVAIFDRDPASGSADPEAGRRRLHRRGRHRGAGRLPGGRALEGARRVVVSPDGKSVYVASFDAGAVAIFDRDPTTGALHQKARQGRLHLRRRKRRRLPEGQSASNGQRDRRQPRRQERLRRRAGSREVAAGCRAKGALAVLARDPATGALTAVGRRRGLLLQDGSGGACAGDPAIGSADEVLRQPRRQERLRDQRRLERHRGLRPRCRVPGG